MCSLSCGPSKLSCILPIFGSSSREVDGDYTGRKLLVAWMFHPQEMSYELLEIIVWGGQMSVGR
jgi:hypothetical protein